MKTLRIDAAVAGLVTVALAVAPAAAQQDRPELSPEAQAEAAAWMKLAAPGSHHEHLARFVGTWKGLVKMWMAPGADPFVEDSIVEVESIMGGRYLVWKHTGTFGGMPFEGMAIEGYNNGQKRYESTWIDSFGTLMINYTGSCDDDGKVRRMKTRYADPVTGGTIDYRTELRWEDDDHFTYLAYMGTGGGEFKHMEISLERQ